MFPFPAKSFIKKPGAPQVAFTTYVHFSFFCNVFAAIVISISVETGVGGVGLLLNVKTGAASVAVVPQIDFFCGHDPSAISGVVN